MKVTIRSSQTGVFVPTFDGTTICKIIERIARTSHKSTDRVTNDSWNPFIRKVVLTHGDWSVVEHVSLTANLYTTRAVANELVRHRLGAYTQESTRFVNYTKQELSFVVAFQDGLLTGTIYDEIVEACHQAASKYEKLLTMGATPQEAREVLPLCTGTELWVTYNLRQWRHVMLMRTTKQSHPMMRQLMVPLLQQLKQIPYLFDDIVPGATQAHNLTLGR